MTSVSHPTPTAPAPTISRPRVWAWPLAIILGFPIAGYVANLTVGAVDSIGAALAGGLIAGAVVGAAQWLALRRVVPWIWIAATSIGMAAGLTFGAALVDYGDRPGGPDADGCRDRSSLSEGCRRWCSHDSTSPVRPGGR